MPTKPADSSLFSVYKFHCARAQIKPNSGLLKLLPKEPGKFITEINMDFNYIGVKGLQPLLEILRLNRGLRVLNLKDNNLENSEVKALAQVLVDSPENALQVLDLSNNPISLAGGSVLVELLGKKRSIIEVKLVGTLIQPKILEKIEELTALNRAFRARPSVTAMD
jgi:Ran GTPase-activating protein (RanGAP) involved in mRNA processing and transport